MTDAERTHLSKFLGLVLRHQPEVARIALDAEGWVGIEALLDGCAAVGKSLTRTQLEEIVATSPKRRFAISADGLRIRASQGHSVDVELGYAPAVPPDTLFHGTVPAALAAIRADGLSKMQRHHVHLSADEPTARTVAARRGKPIILRIAAATLHAEGRVFYLSANGVWLVDAVPARCITFPDA